MKNLDPTKLCFVVSIAVFAAFDIVLYLGDGKRIPSSLILCILIYIYALKKATDPQDNRAIDSTLILGCILLVGR